MQASVFVTRPIPEAGLALLQEEKDLKVEVNQEDRVLTREELLALVKGKAGILSLLTDRIDAAVLGAAGPALKVVSNMAVGYDNVDLEEATRRGVVVTNTPGVLTETTADLTWALILGIARRIVEADAFMRGGHYRAWGPMLLLGADVHGKTLGIIGFGRIGKAVYERALGFKMKVLVSHPGFHGEFRFPGARLVSLEELLSGSDFVTVHAPLNSKTRHLIGEKELCRMKPTAYLINTARGPLVDEAALAEALKEKRIAGAALDVYENEPAMHPALPGFSNVILLPHIGSASRETRSLMAGMAARNLLAVLKGERPPNPVNPQLFTSS